MIDLKSDTPISDANVRTEITGYEMVPYHIAQELERKCAAAQEERLCRAYKLGQELSTICREIKGNLPEQFEDVIDQNIDSLHDILNNFAGIRIHVFMEGKKCEINT